MIKISVDTHSSAKGNPQMKKKKDILSLLEEVQTVAQTLYSEQATLEDHVKTIAAEMSTLRAEKAQLAQALQAPPPQAEPTKIEANLSKLRAEKTQEIWNLQEINAHLTQELQETQTQLAQGVPSGKENIDSLPPEFQNLKEQLHYAEFHNFLLEQEVSNQHDEIQVLERSLETATSQASPSSPVDESIATSSS
ncbi:MAG: hypothetical protein IH978_08800 [Nitrospinae bacterium]|nr:hypothetical protein [Nitrospinota bacterium]